MRLIRIVVTAVLLFFLCNLAYGKHVDVPDIHVDMCELNHCYREDGKQLLFTQVILWTWDASYRRFNCDGWFIVENHWEFLVLSDGIYYLDGRIIRPRIFRETWTTHDPERENQKLFPHKNRAGWIDRKTWLHKRYKLTTP